MTDAPADWPFPADDVDAVADDSDVAPARLTAVLEDHQAVMAETPGVENLVYEWRKQFDATLLARTEAVYVVEPPAWAWEEFGDHLEVTPTERAALRAVHRRVAAGFEDVALDAREPAPMVLVR